MSKKLSGAQFKKRRVEKQEAEKEVLSKVAKISSFFKTGGSSSNTLPEIPENKEVQEKNVEENTLTMTNTSVLEPTQTEVEVSPHPSEIDSSDKGNFSGVLNTEQKSKIIKLGAFQPKGPFPKDLVGRNINRGFSEKFYYKFNGHLNLKRQWLCYSTKTNFVIVNRAGFLTRQIAIRNS